MNLFWMRAAFLADTHVVKMPLEYTQLLSTAYHLHGQEPPSGYRATHKAHPCAIWTAQSLWHWRTVVVLAFDALHEYARRFGRVHKCYFKVTAMMRAPPRFGETPPPAFKPTTVLAEMGRFRDVPLCMPEEFHHPRAAVAYHRYYLHKLRTVPQCARWHRQERRAMHYIAVAGVLRRMQQVHAAHKRKRAANDE